MNSLILFDPADSVITYRNPTDGAISQSNLTDGATSVGYVSHNKERLCRAELVLSASVWIRAAHSTCVLPVTAPDCKCHGSAAW